MLSNQIRFKKIYLQKIILDLTFFLSEFRLPLFILFYFWTSSLFPLRGRNPSPEPMFQTRRRNPSSESILQTPTRRHR